jgi:hypothetical protein
VKGPIKFVVLFMHITTFLNVLGNIEKKKPTIRLTKFSQRGEDI